MAKKTSEPKVSGGLYQTNVPVSQFKASSGSKKVGGGSSRIGGAKGGHSYSGTSHEPTK